MKKIILFGVAALLHLTVNAQSWGAWPETSADLSNQTQQSVTIVSHINSTSITDLQVSSKFQFNLKTNTEYRLSFNAKSSKPCKLTMRFGDEFDWVGIDSMNYFRDIERNLITSFNYYVVNMDSTKDKLIDNLTLYFQFSDITKDTRVDITDIKFEEIIGEGPNPPIEIPLDAVVYDLMGYPFRTDKYANDSNWTQWGKHEGELNVNIPHNDWEDGSRPRQWMNKGSNQAITTWGQIIEGKTGSPEKRIRFQIRNHIMYAFTGGVWKVLEKPTKELEAKLFDKNGFKDLKKHAQIRAETINCGGGVSIACHNDTIIHWWLKGSGYSVDRGLIPDGVEAFFIRCEIRYIPADGYSDSDIDKENVNYYAGVGADYYLDVKSEGGDSMPGLSIPRHKRITDDWRVFTNLIVGSEFPQEVSEYSNNIRNLGKLPPYVIDVGTKLLQYKDVSSYVSLSSDRNYLSVESLDDKAKLNIFDTNGRLLKSKIVKNGEAIPISNFPKGIYVIELIMNNSTFSGKIIK